MASSTLEKNNGKNKKRPARKKAYSGRQSLNNDGIAKRGNLGRQHPGGTKTMSSPPPLREPRELHSKRQILTPPGHAPPDYPNLMSRAAGGPVAPRLL